MPSAANIVLQDAQATPVSHTYVPLGPDPKDQSIFWFEDQSAVSAAGYWRLSFSIKRPPIAPAGFNPNAPQRFYRVTLAVYQPILETPISSSYNGIAPAPTVSYINRSFVELSFPDRNSLQNRKDLRKMTAGFLEDATVLAAIENLQSFF